jgi:hypothetical protein
MKKQKAVCLSAGTEKEIASDCQGFNGTPF